MIHVRCKHFQSKNEKMWVLFHHLSLTQVTSELVLTCRATRVIDTTITAESAPGYENVPKTSFITSRSREKALGKGRWTARLPTWPVPFWNKPVKSIAFQIKAKKTFPIHFLGCKSVGSTHSIDNGKLVTVTVTMNTGDTPTIGGW